MKETSIFIFLILISTIAGVYILHKSVYNEKLLLLQRGESAGMPYRRYID